MMYHFIAIGHVSLLFNTREIGMIIVRHQPSILLSSMFATVVKLNMESDIFQIHRDNSLSLSVKDVQAI